MVLTVLPSPLVVGVIAVTRISLPRRVGKRSSVSEANLCGVASVRLDQVVGETEPFSDFGYGSDGHQASIVCLPRCIVRHT